MEKKQVEINRDPSRIGLSRDLRRLLPLAPPRCALRSSPKEMEIDWPPMDGGASCGRATAVPTTARMVREVPIEHFGKTVRANQRCVEEEVSAVLSGVEVPQSTTPCPGRTLSPTSPPTSRCSPSTSKKDQEPPRPRRSTAGFSSIDSTSRTTPDSRASSRCRIWSPRGPFSLLFLRMSQRQDQSAPLEPPPEHGRIQFHQLNIKNDYRLEGHQDVGSDDQPDTICIPAYYNTRHWYHIQQFHGCPSGGKFCIYTDPIQISAYCLPSFPLALCCGIAMQVKYCSENNEQLIHFSTREVCGNAIGSFPPKDHSLLQVNKFFRFAVVDGVSSQVINDLAKVWVDA
uniref:Uncharacterized protein n=1 Tax=Ananas comosus var. bracteatus TaxID=296719 RepID=A0A6V7PMT5_ANACO|nr:unnamed protein product [Ananas comosus var. bracteatus]